MINETAGMSENMMKKLKHTEHVFNFYAHFRLFHFSFPSSPPMCSSEWRQEKMKNSLRNLISELMPAKNKRMNDTHLSNTQSKFRMKRLRRVSREEGTHTGESWNIICLLRLFIGEIEQRRALASLLWVIKWLIVVTLKAIKNSSGPDVECWRLISHFTFQLSEWKEKESDWKDVKMEMSEKSIGFHSRDKGRQFSPERESETVKQCVRVHTMPDPAEGI